MAALEIFRIRLTICKWFLGHLNWKGGRRVQVDRSVWYALLVSTAGAALEGFSSKLFVLMLPGRSRLLTLYLLRFSR